jgi:fermentation-respiration switch protein FrsA (DUF1100 family)
MYTFVNMQLHRTTKIVLLLTVLLLEGCTGLFYFPDRTLLHDPKTLGLTPQEIFFPSADGTKLFAWHLRHKKGKAKGLILQYHGNAENLSSHYLNLVWLLDEGYDLLVFDYRGYGRSEGDPSQDGTVMDGEAALRLAHKTAGNLPLIVYGQSLGGAIALRNVIDLKKEIPIRAVVIESSFASYQRVAQKVLKRGILTWPFQWLPYLVISNSRAPGDDVKYISPIPLLVIHGTEDKVVDYSLGEMLYESAREPKEFWSVEGAGHLDLYFLEKGKYRAEFLRRLEKRL